MKWLLFIGIVGIMGVFFLVGAVNGNYDCCGHLWVAFKGLAGFVLDAVRTEILGAKIIAGLFGV